MQEGIVLGALGFFLETTRAVIRVVALESKTAIGSENSAAGKASGVIDLITNCLSEFAILPSGCGDGFVLRIVELINGA
jgi:hypothetical protein